MEEKKLTGKIAREHLSDGNAQTARGTDRGLQIAQEQGIVSDVMDQLGMTGAVCSQRCSNRPGPRDLHRRPRADRSQHRPARTRLRNREELRQQNGRIRGPQFSLSGGRSGARGCYRNFKHGGNLGPSTCRARPAPSVSGGIRDIAHSAAGPVPPVGQRSDPDHGQVAARNRGSQRGDRDLARPRGARRHRDRRRHGGMLHPPGAGGRSSRTCPRKKSAAEEERCRSIEAGIAIADTAKRNRESA